MTSIGRSSIGDINISCQNGQIKKEKKWSDYIWNKISSKMMKLKQIIVKKNFNGL